MGTAMASLSRALVAVVARDLAVQLGCAAVAIKCQTEVFYDFSASCTYIYLIIQSLLAHAKGGQPTLRAAVNSGMAVTWAMRLGSFLLQRIIHDGGRDSRFDKARTRPRIFIIFWMVQALWIFLTALPVYVVNCKQSLQVENGAQQKEIKSEAANGNGRVSLRDRVGWTMWIAGFLMQVVADRQKSAFRARPDSKGRFINEGLWSMAQHPNYGGEIMMWTGLFTSCSSELRGAELLSAISPMFVAYLLTQVSGVPMLRKANMRKWGNDPAYLKYLDSTPLLWPFTNFLGLGAHLK